MHGSFRILGTSQTMLSLTCIIDSNYELSLILIVFFQQIEGIVMQETVDAYMYLTN